MPSFFFCERDFTRHFLKRKQKHKHTENTHTHTHTHDDDNRRMHVKLIKEEEREGGGS